GDESFIAVLLGRLGSVLARQPIQRAVGAGDETVEARSDENGGTHRSRGLLGQITRPHSTPARVLSGQNNRSRREASPSLRKLDQVDARRDASGWIDPHFVVSRPKRTHVPFVDQPATDIE